MKFILDRRKPTHTEEGFTLIELVITITIIAILAGIAVLFFVNQQKAAHVATVQHDVANARSFIPGSAGRVTGLTEFASKVNVTANNKALYVVSEDRMNACYQVSKALTATESVTYKYETTEGKVKEGNCSEFITRENGSSIEINGTPSETETPQAGGNTSGNTETGGTTGGTSTGGGTTTLTPPATPQTTNDYITAKVSVANILNDWAGVYQAKIVVTPKQNKAALWTVTWTDPSVTGIQAAWNVDCTVATGGVITCSSRPDHYTTNNLQWGQTVEVEIQLKTTNKTTAPSNPTVTLTATPV